LSTHGSTYSVKKNRENFEDIKWVIRACKSTKNRQFCCQKTKDKQSSIKHYTENYRMKNSKSTKIWGWTQVLRKD